jgi:hypothetical protein
MVHLQPPLDRAGYAEVSTESMRMAASLVEVHLQCPMVGSVFGELSEVE